MTVRLYKTGKREIPLRFENGVCFVDAETAKEMLGMKGCHVYSCAKSKQTDADQIRKNYNHERKTNVVSYRLDLVAEMAKTARSEEAKRFLDYYENLEKRHPAVRNAERTLAFAERLAEENKKLRHSCESLVGIIRLLVQAPEVLGKKTLRTFLELVTDIVLNGERDFMKVLEMKKLEREIEEGK